MRGERRREKEKEESTNRVGGIGLKLPRPFLQDLLRRILRFLVEGLVLLLPVPFLDSILVQEGRNGGSGSEGRERLMVELDGREDVLGASKREQSRRSGSVYASKQKGNVTDLRSEETKAFQRRNRVLNPGIAMLNRTGVVHGSDGSVDLILRVCRSEVVGLVVETSRPKSRVVGYDLPLESFLVGLLLHSMKRLEVSDDPGTFLAGLEAEEGLLPGLVVGSKVGSRPEGLEEEEKRSTMLELLDWILVEGGRNGSSLEDGVRDERPSSQSMGGEARMSREEEEEPISSKVGLGEDRGGGNLLLGTRDDLEASGEEVERLGL